MTGPGGGNLATIRRLIAAAGGSGGPILTDVACAEYDWHSPSHFTGPQMARVGELATAVAGGLSKVLAEHLRDATGLSALPARQASGGQAGQTLASRPGHRLSLSAGGKPCGMLWIDSVLAARWIIRLLGGSEAPAAVRALSDLEAGLLADIARRLVEAVADCLRSAGGPAVQPEGDLTDEKTPLALPEDRIYCLLPLAAGPNGQQAAVQLTLDCEAVDPAVGQAAESHPAGPDGADPRALMTEHVTDASVVAEVLVGRTRLTMRDVMDLSAGDVVLLPVRLDEPAQLLVGRSVVCEGYAAQADGKYAFQIARNFACASAGRPAAKDKGPRQKGT